MALDIIGVCTPIIDLIRTGRKVEKHLGHSTLNTIAALSYLGMRTGAIGRVGKDANGQMVIKDLERLGIGHERLRKDNLPTAECLIDLDGSERHFRERSGYQPLVSLDSDDNAYLKSAKSVFIRAANPLYAQVAAVAKQNGVSLYTTLHAFPEERIDLQAVISSGSRVVLCSQDELWQAAALAEIPKHCEMVVTKGKNGCTVYSSGRKADFAAFKINAIDTTGAGDAFAAGYIYGDLQGWPIAKKAQFASAMGALACLQRGARTRLYSHDEIASFMKTHGVNLA
ncbi:MAG: hypothetical protein HY519_02180 [Candidatus Aenigmarchaeota archaeon]|nr:hypothetical protein [Candidatus Aenigmarchaeota archaeon]